MISTTTIRLNDKVKKAGQQITKEQSIRGGFSSYVESLIKVDLKKRGIDFDKEGK